MQMLVTGEPIDAGTALRAGLVNSVHPQAELRDAVLRIARVIAANSPAAVREVRGAVLDGESCSIDDAIRVELEHYERLVDHPDRYEGIAAWGEKRSPRFEDPQ
jgi:enoyl-CoA hydratase/carnithine racemase